MNAPTFRTLSRELLEAELVRCNEIMLEDGRKLGRLKQCVLDLAKLGQEQIDRIARLEHSCNALALHVQEYLQETGGCDHSVGICVCRIVRDLDQARSLLGLKPLTEPDQPDPEPGCATITSPR